MSGCDGCEREPDRGWLAAGSCELVGVGPDAFRRGRADGETVSGCPRGKLAPSAAVGGPGRGRDGGFEAFGELVSKRGKDGGTTDV